MRKAHYIFTETISDMSSFRNPMEAEYSTSQKISLFFWFVFTSASIYCAAQSFHDTTGLEKLLCYLMAGAILGTATLCLNLIKKSTSEGYVAKRRLKFYIGILVFIPVWFFIVMANTHYIYFKMSADRLRLSELTTVRKNFDLVQNKVINQIDTMTSNYDTKIENEIANLKAEITNPWNPGHDTGTNKILKRIEYLIGDNASLLTMPPKSSDKNGLRMYADENANKIRTIRDNNLLVCKKKRAEIQTFFQDPNSKNILITLDNVIKDFEIRNSIEKRNVLRNSYALFDKAYKMISDISIPLGKNNLKIDITAYKLNDTPPSIDIEDFATAWKYFFNNVHNARFIVSIILAMIIDVACFMFWYFGWLPQGD